MKKTMFSLLILMFSFSSSYCMEKYYYKNFTPPKVLFISESHYIAPFVFNLERMTDADIIYSQIFYNDQDYHHLCDKPLEELKSDIEYVNKAGEKYLTDLLNHLNQFDVIFASFRPNSNKEGTREKLFSIERKIVKTVKNGKPFVFINPSWEVVFENTPLAEIMPVRFDGRRKTWTFCPGKASEHPLVFGLPFEIAGTYWYGPVYVPIDEKSIPLTVRENYPNFWYRKVGKGKVIFLYALPASRVNWRGTTYDTYAGDRPDDVEVWYSFFRRLAWYLKYGETIMPVVLNIEIENETKIKYGDKIEIPVKIKNLTRSTQQVEVVFQIKTRYSDTVSKSKKIILAGLEEIREKFEFSVNFPPTDKYIYLKAMVLTPKEEIISESYKWIEYQGLISIDLKTDRVAYKVGENVEVNVECSGFKKDKKYEIVTLLIDRTGRILNSKKVKVKPSGAKQNLTFNFKMPKEEPEYLSCYWFKCLVINEKEIVGSSPFYQIQNNQVWNMRKQFQFSLWTSGGSLPKMELLFDAGFNSLGYPGNTYICDRYGLRQYVESTGINTFGVKIKHPNWEGVRKEMEEVIEDLNKRGPDTRSKCLVSLQEEGGFDGGWGVRYYWEEEKASAIPQKVFDDYLRELYKNDIRKLNEEWNASYRSFDEIPLERSKSVFPSDVFVTSQAWNAMAQNQKKKKIPVDLKNINLNQRYIAYTAPFYETYRFFDWYYQKYCDLATEIYKKNRNPVPLTICSAPGGFYPKVDVYNFAGLGPFYPKEVGLIGNAIARRDYGDIPGFSAAMWAYFDLRTLWECTVLSSIIAGNSHIDYWVDTPLTFNPDLTHTRASFWTKELRKKLKPIEPVLLHKKFCYTKWLGIFIPVQPLPKGILGRHFGSAIDCNAPVYSALEESGYMPKVVNLEELPRISVLIASYAQVVGKQEGEKIKEFVEKGGILISTPWFASCSPHGNFYTIYPSDESGLSEMLGFRLINTSQDLMVEEFTIDSDEYPELKGLVIKSKGRDRVIDLKEDVKILARYKDGNPAILERKYGKGKVIYLNFIYDWDNWWSSFYEKPRESYRRLIDTLIKKNSVVKNEYFISFVKLEKTELNKGWWNMVIEDTPNKGDAIPYWASQLYSDPKGKIKYLGVFSDHRSPIIQSEIYLKEKNIKMIDLLEHKELRKNERDNYEIVLKPGEGRIFALIEENAVPKDIIVKTPSFVKTGETLEIDISLKNAKEGIYGAIVEVFDPEGEYLRTCSILNLQLSDGKGKAKIYFAENDRSGNYKIIITESITGLKKEVKVRVAGGKSIEKEKLNPFPNRKEDKPYLFELSDGEFIELFERLRDIYKGNYEGLENKYMLSYYLYVPFRPQNRHFIVRRLQRTEWMKHLNEFIQAIKNGEKFYLIGEDINVDPISGLEIDPLASKDIEEFLEILRRKGDTEVKRIENMKIEKIKIGEGYLAIIYDTVDRNIYHSEDFKKWHEKIKNIIEKI